MQKTNPDRYTRFIDVVDELADVYGVCDSIDIQHHIQILRKAIEQHLFAIQSGVSGKKQDSKRKFIAIFQNRYREFTDLEYPKAVTSIEAKAIETTIKKLEEQEAFVEDYLDWFFEKFLPENKKFAPPNIKLLCGDFLLQKFFYTCKDLITQRKKNKLQAIEEVDLYNRLRSIVRETGNNELMQIVKDFQKGAIMFDEFRVKIVLLEQEHSRNKEKLGDVK